MANVTSLSQALTRSLASTSSESDNEFLESCRPKSLLEDLEDDDELPDHDDDDDDDENDDENEDDDFYDDVLVVSYSNCCQLEVSLITRKPVFGVCDQGRLKPACLDAETR